MARFNLSDEEWVVIEPLLPKPGRRPKRKNDRRILNSIFYILRTSAPWRDLPERYGPRTTVYNRYARWGQRGVWNGIFDGLAQECDDALVFIDASIVKAHRSASGAKRGDWRKVLATHAAVAIVADKAYGRARIRQQINDEGALAVIPSKRNARKPIPYDVNLYAQRNIVERVFCKMKDMRRLATRFEKLGRNFMAMLHLFAIRCWIN